MNRSQSRTEEHYATEALPGKLAGEVPIERVFRLAVGLCLAAALLLGAWCCQAAGANKDALWQAFENPPPQARASCYWWWKGNLSGPEMGRQLRLLKNAGLGGAHIIPWQSEPVYLSPEWLRLLRAAADAAHQEGMILDLSANAWAKRFSRDPTGWK